MEPPRINVFLVLPRHFHHYGLHRLHSLTGELFRPTGVTLSQSNLSGTQANRNEDFHCDNPVYDSLALENDKKNMIYT